MMDPSPLGKLYTAHFPPRPVSEVEPLWMLLKKHAMPLIASIQLSVSHVESFGRMLLLFARTIVAADN
jgi:hypothetical protein